MPSTSEFSLNRSVINSTLSTPPDSAGSSSADDLLPECWSDDERMSCLMSVFKNRAVNPVEYDSKLKFWNTLILSSCSHLKKPYLTHSELVQRFRRKDRLPAGLQVVLRDMLDRGDLIDIDDYMLAGNSWLWWTFDLALKRPVSWLFGFSNDKSDVTKRDYIIPKVLNELCHKVMEIRRSLMDKIVSPTELKTSSVIEYKRFVKCMEPFGFDQKSLSLIVEQLRRMNLVSIDKSDFGEKLLKFREDDEQNENAAITDSDKKFYKLQKMIETLESELQKLEEAAAKLDVEARSHIRAKNRAKAKQSLRQKLSILKQIKSKETALNNGMMILNQLAQTKEQKQILDAFKAGVTAFKDDMAKHGLTLDKVDETMDDIHETVLDNQDISDALGRNLASGMQVYSDAELEEELADLLKENDLDSSKNKAINLPDIPSSPALESQFSTSTPIAKVAANDGDNLSRLRRLLESDH